MVGMHNMQLYLLLIPYKHQLSKERQEFKSNFALYSCGLFPFVLTRQTKVRNLITIQLMIATGNFYYPTDLCQDGLTYIKFQLSVVVVHKVNIPSKCPVSKWLQYVIKLESQFPIFHGVLDVEESLDSCWSERSPFTAFNKPWIRLWLA